MAARPPVATHLMPLASELLRSDSFRAELGPHAVVLDDQARQPYVMWAATGILSTPIMQKAIRDLISGHLEHRTFTHRFSQLFRTVMEMNGLLGDA